MKIAVELIAIERPGITEADKNRVIELADGTPVADAVDALRLGDTSALVTMVNGELVHRDDRAAQRLADGDTLIVCRAIKGG